MWPILRSVRKNWKKGMTTEDTEDLLESVSNVEVTGIVSEAVNTANTIDENDVELAKEKLIESVASAGDKTVTLYVQTYLGIKPKSYNSETKVLKLDVTTHGSGDCLHGCNGR